MTFIPVADVRSLRNIPREAFLQTGRQSGARRPRTVSCDIFLSVLWAILMVRAASIHGKFGKPA